MTPYYTWNGNRYEAKQFDKRDGGFILVIECPKCGNGIPFDSTGKGKEQWLPHALSFAEDGAITASPSVVCAYECGWHVIITAGDAKDC